MERLIKKIKRRKKRKPNGERQTDKEKLKPMET